jgi:hypothetical protein
MIRSGRWKLWLFADSEDLPPSLFDLEEDPQETADLGESSEHSEIRDELLSKLMSGWDPHIVAREAHMKTIQYELLAKWGSEIKPEIPGTLGFPPPSLEDEVEIL